VWKNMDSSNVSEAATVAVGSTRLIMFPSKNIIRPQNMHTLLDLTAFYILLYGDGPSNYSTHKKCRSKNSFNRFWLKKTIGLCHLNIYLDELSSFWAKMRKPKINSHTFYAFTLPVLSSSPQQLLSIEHISVSKDYYDLFFQLWIIDGIFTF